MDQIWQGVLSLFVWVISSLIGVGVAIFILEKIKRYIIPFSNLEWHHQFYCEIERKTIIVDLTRKQMIRINQTPVETIKDLNRITKMSNKEYKEYRFARRI